MHAHAVVARCLSLHLNSKQGGWPSPDPIVGTFLERVFLELRRARRRQRVAVPPRQPCSASLSRATETSRVTRRLDMNAPSNTGQTGRCGVCAGRAGATLMRGRCDLRPCRASPPPARSLGLAAACGGFGPERLDLCRAASDHGLSRGQRRVAYVLLGIRPANRGNTEATENGDERPVPGEPQLPTNRTWLQRYALLRSRNFPQRRPARSCPAGSCRGCASRSGCACGSRARSPAPSWLAS